MKLECFANWFVSPRFLSLHPIWSDTAFACKLKCEILTGKRTNVTTVGKSREIFGNNVHLQISEEHLTCYSTFSVGMEIDEMFPLALNPLSLFYCNMLVVFEENNIHKRWKKQLRAKFEELLFGAEMSILFSVMSVLICVQLLSGALQ